jgi:hypothetical protein
MATPAVMTTEYCNSGGEETGQPDAAGGQCIAREAESQFDVPARHVLPNAHSALLRPSLGCHSVGNARPFERFGDVPSCRLVRDVGNRPRTEQGALESVNRCDIRLWGTRARTDPEDDASQRRTCRGNDFALLDRIIQDRQRDDREIDRASLDLLLFPESAPGLVDILSLQQHCSLVR